MNPYPSFINYFSALFPGLGHSLIGRHTRAMAYGIPFWGVVVLFFFLISVRAHEGAFVFFFLDIALWVICLIDTLICINQERTKYLMHNMHAYANPLDPNVPPIYANPYMNGSQHSAHSYGPMPYEQPLYPTQTGTAKIIFLSIIPGIAHFYMGLMKRGLTTMALFFSVPIFLSFVSGMTGRGGFMGFLLIMPVIWFYSLFDAFHLYRKKMQGERISDQSFFEDFYQNRPYDTKNRTIATLLSIFPGAGHLYLGAQKRGIQLMIVFLVSLYLMDMMRLSIFLFLVPIIWFFAFFDSLQLISKYETYGVEDRPVISGYLTNYRKWIGLGMIFIAFYFVFERLGGVVFRTFFDIDYNQWNKIYFIVKDYMQVIFVAAIFIIGGLFLLLRKKSPSAFEE
ncbi:hypothetical protein NV379_21030 [Paenibacillus sp. N1-5-1-14]|uniref:hypothetical protein n=1 Tax=Paenibacillus radicibacter TaxID=2972488 RepID=UPI00215988FA|nr:hypothetical protein [Paenibacillus radicibacter]MCR8645144.1 hypothetical protein [Paenibacillus radicibacter]